MYFQEEKTGCSWMLNCRRRSVWFGLISPRRPWTCWCRSIKVMPRCPSVRLIIIACPEESTFYQRSATHRVRLRCLNTHCVTTGSFKSLSERMINDRLSFVQQRNLGFPCNWWFLIHSMYLYRDCLNLEKSARHSKEELLLRMRNPPPVNTELWDYRRASINMEWDQWSKYAELQQGLVLDVLTDSMN